ncbi:semaphorin-3D [Gadus morhua]|uniref:semaphorin-3D n=1 Tax=Gadus morhua TaxID=8049 RepID=UPI0011B69D72|nr:semaphorin-3D-like [Gadus morhua]
MSSALGAEGGAMQRWVGLMLWLLPLAWVPAVTADLYASEVKLVTQIGPRLQLSHADLRNSSAVFWEGGVSGGYQALLLDEDRGWLLVGGKDHIYLLRSDSLDLPTRTIYWPASPDHVEHCRQAGKSLEMECANFVRVLQPFNKTHVYVCGTGAYDPQCSYLHLGDSSQDPVFLLSPTVESGRGRCPFSPSEPFTARLTDGELYSGTSVDFMGANAAIFRTAVQANSQDYIRTEAYDDHWLNEPEFVGSFSIPDTHSPDDDKVYFFYREKAVEGGQWNKMIHSRVARVCKNDVGGKRSLINRWTTFQKARLVCSIPGPSGMDTVFDELQDIFLLETKDPQNPTLYGVFTTSSAVFRGSAVCVYSMASIRAAFNGPFAHKDGPDYRWTEFRGRIPYPRPGTCPSETYDALYRSTRDLPDEVVSFVRQHQLMWEPVLPLGNRPVLTLSSAPYCLRKVVVDRVETDEGPFDVLHLGTDDGRLLKAVSVMKDSRHVEEIILEELTLFQTPSPILSMQMSSKRRQLYVSSTQGVVQLGVHRCGRYGQDCPACCLARDPYCSWDGQACSRTLPSSRRRSRRQDVRHGDPWSQCPQSDNQADSVETKVLYGVEGNSTFLECVAKAPLGGLRWTVRSTDPQSNNPQTTRPAEGDRQLPSDDSRSHTIKRGLLVQRLELADGGFYTCTAHEHSYSQVLARYQLHVIPQRSLLSPGGRLYHLPVALGPVAPRGGPHPHPRGSWLAQGLAPQAASPRGYKDLLLAGSNSLSQDEYCEQLWYREKRRQQKLRALKLKQESRKARVRRNYAPGGHL